MLGILDSNNAVLAHITNETKVLVRFDAVELFVSWVMKVEPDGCKTSTPVRSSICEAVRGLRIGKKKDLQMSKVEGILMCGTQNFRVGILRFTVSNLIRNYNSGYLLYVLLTLCCIW